MKVLINQHQLDLFTENFHIYEGNITPNELNQITETRLKEFLVTFWIGGYISQIRISSSNSATARMAVSKLFKNARLTGEVSSL